MLGLRISLAALACVVVAACDGAFDLAHVPSVDAALDAPLGPCVEDDFESGAFDPSRWLGTGTSPGVVVEVQAGHAVFAIPAATTSTQDPTGSLDSHKRDLTGAVAQVEILEVPSPTALSEIVEGLFVDSKNNYGMLVGRNRLVTRQFVAGQETNDSVAYDSVQHRFIRMRHDTEAGAMVYEARSADGPWTEVSRTQADVPLTNANLKLYAGSFDVAPAFNAVIDNVQLLGPCTF